MSLSLLCDLREREKNLSNELYVKREREEFKRSIRWIGAFRVSLVHN